MERTPLVDRAKGSWTSILLGVGIDRSFLSGKNGPCPFCGGKDRWRYTNLDNRGMWICNACGAGDGIELVKRYLKVDFKEAAKRIETELRQAEPDKPHRAVDEKKMHKAMEALWRSSQPVSGPGARYFAARRLPLPSPRAVRYIPHLMYDRTSAYPALIARVCDAAGHGINLHRTWLAPDGSAKAPVEKPRLMMKARVPQGSAIRLFPVGEVLGVAEGIETALAAHVMYGVPVWSCIAANLLERFAIPDEVDELLIFADNDRSYTGQAAAYNLAKRCTLVAKKRATVIVPPNEGQDFNDLLGIVDEAIGGRLGFNSNAGKFERENVGNRQAAGAAG